MPVPLPHYVKIKDKYCVSYFGNCNEYLVLLKLLRPKIEQTLPGLQLYIACKDEALQLLNKEKNVVSNKDFRKEDYAYVRELNCDMRTHPISELMDESEIPYPSFTCDEKKFSSCVIYTKGNLPTKNLTKEEIELCEKHADNKGCGRISIDKEYSNEDWVISVENEKLFEFGSKGINVTLVKKGIGENIFKKLFPDGEILNVNAK